MPCLSCKLQLFGCANIAQLFGCTLEVGMVERETLVPATPEETWRALLDSDWLTRIDPVPGGEVEGEGGSGFVEEAEAPRRLSFWWGEDATRVEIELDEVEEGTHVRVVESRPLAVLDAYGSDLGAAIRAPQGPQALAAVA
jgi:uncharacterized protein YndB with AHSA1/START domain